MRHHHCGPKAWGHHGRKYGYRHHRGGDFRVPVNVAKTEDSYIIYVAAPGRNKEDFKVSVQGDELTITYKKPETAGSDDQNWVRYEYRQGSFKRTFLIDETVDPANIEAKYEDGILKITLPIRPGSIVPSQDVLIA